VKGAGDAANTPVVFGPCGSFCGVDCDHIVWEKRDPKDPPPVPNRYQLVGLESQRCLSHSPKDKSAGYVILNCKSDGSQKVDFVTPVRKFC